MTENYTMLVTDLMHILHKNAWWKSVQSGSWLGSSQNLIDCTLARVSPLVKNSCKSVLYFSSNPTGGLTDKIIIPSKWNEMKWMGFKPPSCTYRLNRIRRTSWVCEMNEMTLSSTHRIRYSNPGGLRPSSLFLGHGGSPQYWIFTSEQGRNILFLWNLKVRVGF